MNPLIYIVDDDIFFRTHISYILNQSNFNNVRSFCSGELLCDNLNPKPDIIVLDHDMTGMTGTDVLKYINKHMLNIPVIMVSGREEEELINEVIRLGAKQYFKKDDMLVANLKAYFNSNYNSQYKMVNSI